MKRRLQAENNEGFYSNHTVDNSLSLFCIADAILEKCFCVRQREKGAPFLSPCKASLAQSATDIRNVIIINDENWSKHENYSSSIYIYIFFLTFNNTRPKVSALSWCFSNSAIIVWTDLLPPKVEIIRGKSDFRRGSVSGLLVYFARSRLMSLGRSSELHQQIQF